MLTHLVKQDFFMHIKYRLFNLFNIYGGIQTVAYIQHMDSFYYVFY